MNWKKWKLGLVVSLAIGFFTACVAAAALDVVINAKFILFFIGLVGKDVVLFLTNHPVDQISFDTTTLRKPPEEKP